MDIRVGIQKVLKELKSKKTKDRGRESKSNTTTVKGTGMKLLKFRYF